MAPRLLPLLVLVALLLCCAVHVAVGSIDDVGRRGRTPYGRVFSFGDSLTDTGNVLHIIPGGPGTQSRPPYGMTFFGRPNGRASDGRIAIDFIAEELGLPTPTTYLRSRKKTAADFQRGVNLAVAGGTALHPAFFETRGLRPFLRVCLGNQTSWFKDVLHSLGSVHEQRKIAVTSLFVVGEIGVNDYVIGLTGNRTLGEVKTFVPHIVGAIRSVVTEVVAAGARTVVIVGMMPLGCEPMLLTRYQGEALAGGYDPESGCIRWLNDLARLHNRQLQRMMGRLRRTHPGTAIVYGDLYRTIADLIVSPAKHGFRGRSTIVACCGGGGAYNVNTSALCGALGSTACADPSKYISWDGMHFTEAANRRIACAVLNGSWLTTTDQAAGLRRIGCDQSKKSFSSVHNTTCTTS